VTTDTPQTIAYHPSATALNFKSKGESQAEFEERERRCLSTAIYFEARGESKQGQIAVGQVILNRVRSPQFPQTICGVVYQGQMEPGCQFSFACDGLPDDVKQPAAWAHSKYIAQKAIAGDESMRAIGSATNYHADYVNPRWARNMKRLIKIGHHIFYSDT
jgi:spore germination cell wall hydrolase CwlJ-like protein